MKNLTSSLLITLLLAQPAFAARPTLRNLRSNAYNLEEVRRSTYRNKAQEYKTFRNTALGFSVKYPADWESSFVTAESLADHIIHFSPERNVKSSLSVWIKEKSAPTYEDLEADFARFSRQPQNDFQIRTMSHIHEIKDIVSEQISWKGKQVLLSTFEAGGVQTPHKYKQVRIPVGSRLFIVSFAAPVANYESEVHRFDPFLASLTTYAQRTQEKAEPTRTDRRSRLTGARQNRRSRITPVSRTRSRSTLLDARQKRLEERRLRRLRR